MTRQPENDPASASAHFLRPGTLQLGALPPLSLYVHLPWCLKKCPYCDFNSHEIATRELPVVAMPPSAGMQYRTQGQGHSTAANPPKLDAATESRYLDALCADLESALPLVWGRRVQTVFIGGGTPSLFSPEGIDRLLADIRARLPLEAGAEITMEANPGTFERDRFRAFRAAGVTRLSVGVQSFDDRALERIGRVHDSAQARAACAEAASAFDTWNLDLMYALPGQDLAALGRDLDTALALKPPHLSIYHLTLEPNTWFAKHPPPLPDEDTASDMLDLITARTAAVGLQRYEVSAFAQIGQPRGHRCAHNLNYWAFGDYLGIGAGAHGKLSFPHRVLRQVRWREPAAYMTHALAGNPVSNQHEVARRDLPFEFMLGALRLRAGFELTSFAERTGLPLSAVLPMLQQAQQQGLVDLDGDRVTPSTRGFDFLSDLQALFLPATAADKN